MNRSKSTRDKRPYEPPRVKRYGDFRQLTGAKAGNKIDGIAKPKTRLAGTNA